MSKKYLVEAARRLDAIAFGFAIVVCSISSRSMAGGTPLGGTVASDQTIAEETVVYPQPPANFDPFSASDDELEQYGFPPRPDQLSAPEAYAHWQKLVSVPRGANPQLKETTSYNGPARDIVVGPTLSNGAVSEHTPNWSGYVVNGSSGTFTSNKVTLKRGGLCRSRRPLLAFAIVPRSCLRSGSASMAICQATSYRPGPRRTQCAQVRKQQPLTSSGTSGSPTRRSQYLQPLIRAT
jgi:hypothetical protein